MTRESFGVEIECGGGQEPQRLRIGEQWIAVTEVVDRWPAPGYCYFKLRGDDDAVYLVRHDEPTGLWELTVYERDAL